MNKFSVCLISVILLSTVLFAGCTGNTNTETQPAATAPITTTAALETTTAAPTTETVAPLLELKAAYTPSKAYDENGTEHSLTEIFGTAYTTYGGSLTFNEDMTFSLTIGINKGDGVGTYKILSDEEIELSYKNGKVAIAKILETSDAVATEISVPRGEFDIIFN
ncbi:MAG: hypothetical protein PUA85_05025 [Oscillospiraceae bacterium]|nr:hypothetical protein [Oscillospiraceae bacterium]